MLNFLGLLSFVLTAAAVASAMQICKCLAGEPCFPSQAEWDEFAKNLSKPLISNQRPAAAPCYSSSSDFDPPACTTAEANRTNADALSSGSNTVQWKNFEYLINSTTVLACPFDPVPGGTCFQGRVPSYSIQVGTTEDIQQTVQFASDRNLRLVVKNTGHELLGRAFGLGSVELFMHGLKEINFTDSFVPSGATSSTAPVAAITVQPGVTWNELYTAANQFNHTVAGGFSVNGTVGAGGGWPVGGGHSILSPFYGLGVDNVLQYTLVLPNASHVTTNAFQHTNIFWALRGGGAPSFGVVTSVTYRAHPNIPFTGGFFTATASSNDSYRALLQTWLEHHNAVADAGWGGVWPFGSSQLSLTLVAQGSPPTSNALSTLQAFYDAARQLSGVDVTEYDTIAFASYGAFAADILDGDGPHHGFPFASFDISGSLSFGTSWLMPRELTAPGNASSLSDVFTNITSLALPFLIGGGVVSTVADDETAVTPAFRNVLSDFTLNVFWNATQNATEIMWIAQQTHDIIEPLRSLAPIPEGGQYLNEADLLEDDWQAAQWGSNYPRLLSIKKEIDPKDLFIVYHGVNSEGWDTEVVCKTT